tara:strand:+ start:1895 stop:2779 length:885 start_codon:yes stop_codon:yes gene_type:complete
MESNRGYLSYSQYALFKSSPKAYYEKYVQNKKSYGTKSQQFGKKLMVDLEFGDWEGVPIELKKLAKDNSIEEEITVTPKFFDKDLFGIIDLCESRGNWFYEIKTGKESWSKAKVLKDEQMLFYALLISKAYGVIPYAKLVWVGTKHDEGGEVEFTGEIKETRRDFTLEEINAFEKTLLQTCIDISDYEHSVVSFGDSVDERLLRLLSEQKRIESELSLLKDEIIIDIKEFQNKYAESENFNITLASRKSYTYSQALNEAIKQTASDFKILKTKEEKEGVATEKVTEYLLIKAKK